MSRILDRLSHPFGRPRSWSQQRRDKYKRKADAELALVIEARPDPLNLSDPIPSSSPASQPLSTFFTRLPLEVRCKVYEYVVGDQVIYLTHISKHVAHLSLPLPPAYYNKDYNENREQANSRIYMPPQPPSIHWRDLPKLIPSPHQFSTLPLSLLQTCRAIYTEALPILYSANIFVCTSPLTLIYLHDLPLLPPTHISHIRHLRLQWEYFTHPRDWRGCVHAPYDDATWSRFWELVAVMPKLITLGVELVVWAKEEEMGVEAGWVREMMRVRGVKGVEARVVWQLMGMRSQQGEIKGELEKAWGSER